MKWIFTLSSFLALHTAFAQQNMEVHEKFCEVWTSGQTLSGQWEIYADSGQARQGWNARQLLMRDQQGILRFQSRMAALNYLGARGWTLISTNTTIEPTSIQNLPNTRYFYLFRKVVPGGERYMIDEEMRGIGYRE